MCVRACLHVLVLCGGRGGWGVRGGRASWGQNRPTCVLWLALASGTFAAADAPRPRSCVQKKNVRTHPHPHTAPARRQRTTCAANQHADHTGPQNISKARLRREGAARASAADDPQMGHEQEAVPAAMYVHRRPPPCHRHARDGHACLTPPPRSGKVAHVGAGADVPTHPPACAYVNARWCCWFARRRRGRHPLRRPKGHRVAVRQQQPPDRDEELPGHKTEPTAGGQQVHGKASTPACTCARRAARAREHASMWLCCWRGPAGCACWRGAR